MPVNTFMEKSDPETTSDCVGSSFADILKMHDHSPACWYHVNHVENSDLNLSSYIGLEKDEYHDVLIALGVLKRTKKNQLWHKTENWKSFLHQHTWIFQHGLPYSSLKITGKFLPSTYFT